MSEAISGLVTRGRFWPFAAAAAWCNRFPAGLLSAVEAEVTGEESEPMALTVTAARR